MHPRNFVDLFLPPSSGVDEWSYRKYRIFVGVCFVSALYALIYIPQVLYMQYYGALYVILAFSIVNIVLPILLKAKASLLILVNIYLLTMALAETRIMQISGGVFHTATDPQILAVLPMLALLFLGLRGAIIWFFIGVAIIITFGVMQSKGIMFPYEMNPKYVMFQTIAASAGHLLIILMVINIFESEKNRALKHLEEKNIQVENEKKRSDDLLLNILPSEVMNELKQTGKTTAKNYGLVTVLFADFKDFTHIIEELPPEDLVAGIDQYFETFDKIVSKYDIEKIKTVGDAYICASGLPVANMNNPVIIIEAALEMASAIEDLKVKRTGQGKVSFDVRFGVHSGPLVAGVVGIKKFAYDIWGDTVNIAARMQQMGMPGKINISAITHDLVKHRFHCVSRGIIEVKNKGGVEMFFVEGKKS